MLSVIVITKNEENNIRRCLESVRWADEIIVVDSGSSDNTVTIAKNYTSKVYEMDWQGYGIQKQRALEKATGDWVLSLDADESVSPSLCKAIQDVIASNEVQACRIPIQMHFYNKPLRFSYSPSRHIRLFKREGASYGKDIVHEKISLPKHLIVKQLHSPILHNSFKDLSHALYKMNHYSSYTAKIRIENRKKASFSKTMLGTLWMFTRCYFLQGGFMDGKAGFMMACLNAQGTFYRGMKQIYQDVQLNALPEVNRDQTL